MIVATFVLTLVNLLGLLFLGFEFLRVSDLYEQMLQVLAGERDALKAENGTLKVALFPQLRQVAGSASVPQQRSGPQASAAAGPAFYPGRVPWRLRFKQLVRQHNTQQMGRDRMAAAISTQEKKDG